MSSRSRLRDKGELRVADEEQVAEQQVMHPSLPFLHCLCQRRWPALMPKRLPASDLRISLPIVDSRRRHVALHCQEFLDASVSQTTGR